MTEREVTDKIVIIGGGIGGLAAALALLTRGLDVEIHEQAPELKEVGARVERSVTRERWRGRPGFRFAPSGLQATSNRPEYIP